MRKKPSRSNILWPAQPIASRCFRSRIPVPCMRVRRNPPQRQAVKRRYPSPTICRPPRRSGKFYSCRASARTESASRVMCPGSICRFAFWELSKRRSGWPRRRGWFALKGRRNTTGSPQHFTRFYPHVFLASLLTLLCHRPPKCSDKVETDITMANKMRPCRSFVSSTGRIFVHCILMAVQYSTCGFVL